MGLLKNIFWEDNTKNTIVYKIDMKNDYISKGSALTVRDSQVAIFAHKGKMCDVFLPGFYKLDTNSIPIITKLLSWKYGFQNPFRSDVYFVNTKQFAGEKWGTVNPIIIRDADYGAVRIRGYGTYSFKVKDAFVFMQELSGTNSSFKTQDVTDYLRSMVITGISDAIGKSKVPILEMAGNLRELGKYVEDSLQDCFNAIGIELTKFNFENFSLPPELEKMMDQATGMGMMRGSMDVYTQMAQADALKEAAKNPGMAGSTMGAGLGMGLGMGMGQMFGNMAQPAAPAAAKASGTDCGKCGNLIPDGAKFCPKCGTPSGAVCPHCKHSVKPGAKFCPDCGKPLTRTCAGCGASLSATAKFCPDCGKGV
ncbi:MAG: SPFH domain-containing protein [Firmicutes bacterium]|nr:SPFH domain-containing protein [Bacillota bacterium]